MLCVVIDPPGEFWCLLKFETHCSLLCCRSVKALVTLWFLVRESATNTFTWSAWGWHHSPMGSSSAWNVKPVSFLVLVDMKGWIRRNVQCQHLPWYLIFLPLLCSSSPISISTNEDHLLFRLHKIERVVSNIITKFPPTCALMIKIYQFIQMYLYFI